VNPGLVKLSKFMSLVLRHNPEEIGLALDENGWADVAELIARANLKGVRLTRNDLLTIVETNDKKRFAFSEDGTRIRASQGHSIEVDLALSPIEPPARLFHGTASRFLESIRAQGLLRGKRQHVHLSPDELIATKVGQRHGKPVVLQVLAGQMHQAGRPFFRSANGVWLTEHVPAEYLVFPPAAGPPA
jgi:putative RNA 2'-phosphotransferase